MFWFNLIWFAGVLFLLFLAARNFFRFALMLIGIHTPSSHMGYWGWHPNAMIVGVYVCDIVNLRCILWYIMKRLAEWLHICKVHWKEIFALSFMLHFVFDVFIFWLGVFVGRYW